LDCLWSWLLLLLPTVNCSKYGVLINCTVIIDYVFCETILIDHL
jgi:hypothetical protein